MPDRPSPASDISASLPPAGDDEKNPRRLVGVICLSLALGYLVFLAGSVLQGFWLVGPDGRPVANDFVMVWAGGRLALDGHAAAAWNWETAKAAAVAAVGHDYDGLYPWFYPPAYLFVAAPFATLPLVPAMLAWLAVTGLAYALVVRGFVGGGLGLLVAAAAPGALWNLVATQNGFLTAALFGGALLALERRPVLAGVLFGVLTIKPQLGLLVPLALLAGGHWRTVVAAVVTTLLLAAASALVFGPEVLDAYLASLPVATKINLAEGLVGWAKLQSVFGLVRLLGGSQLVATLVQGAVTLAVAAVIVVLWARKRTPMDSKAAALACGALLATPYAFVYDLAVLTIPAAVLIRRGIDDGFFARIEIVGLSLAAALVLSFLVVPVQVGLVATAIVMRLVLRRAFAARSA